MDRETRDKKLLLKIQAADSAPRIRCRRAAPARFRSSPPCDELSLRALLTARSRGNFASGTAVPFRREKINPRTQDRHAVARCVRKVPQDSDGRPAIAAIVRSHMKNVGV